MKSSVTDTAQADGACSVVRFGAPWPLQLLGALPPQWHLCAAGASFGHDNNQVDHSLVLLVQSNNY